MILMMHKVDPRTPTQWWLHPCRLEQRLEELADETFVYLSEYNPNNSKHVCLTFDDGYSNVAEYALPILAARRLPFEVFIIGDYVGQWNTFDRAEPPARMATWKELNTIAEYGGRLQWHTRSHKNLASLPREKQLNEILIPQSITERLPPPHCRWLAYPYGFYNAISVELAQQFFEGAVAGNDSDKKLADPRYALARISL